MPTMPSRSAEELLLDELFTFCYSESISENGIHEIVQRHGLTTKNNSNLSCGWFFIQACCNERVTEGILQCLLEYFPDVIGTTLCRGLPLHFACGNRRAAINIIKVLIDTDPTAVRCEDDKGAMPLHKLCMNANAGDKISIQILNLLIETYPEAVRHADDDGNLPIHIAAGATSPEFCRVLIDAYPGSERIIGAYERMPLHCACGKGSLATAEYLYSRYSDAIDHATYEGIYPIHVAIHTIIPIIHCLYDRVNKIAAVETVKFLLRCSPSVKLQKRQGRSLLRYVWRRINNSDVIDDSTMEAAFQVIKVIYDAHPEAIEDDGITSDLQNFRHPYQVRSFINGELVYARQAKDRRLMMTPDDNGRLPLHTAIENNAAPGSIKLLVKGNPDAVQSPDNMGALPLHIACQHRDSTNVVRYLVELDPSTLDAVDREGNTVLHYACSGAKYDMITMLLEKYDAASVSKRNAQNKLPIELLWESEEVSDSESVEYTDSVFRLLQAHPESIMNYNAQEQATAGACTSQNEKKRKLDAV